MRGRLRGGPVVARLGHLLLLPGWSGRLLRHSIQGILGPGSLALREVVASCRAWAPSISPLLWRSGLWGGWRWFGCLLSRRRFGATGSRRRAGAFREEVFHCLRRLLSLRVTFSEALHSWSKQATWRDQSVEEGNFIRLFHLCHREPEVALQHDEAGHRASNRLGCGFGGAQSQVCCTSQVPEWGRIQTGILVGEHIGLKDLKHSHRVQRWSSLSSRWVGASTKCRCSSARFRWMCCPRLPSDSRGRAEMYGHRLIQRLQMFVSFLFSTVNGSESGWSRGADARRIGHTPRFRELLMHFGEEGERALAESLMAPGKNHSSSLLRDGSSGECSLCDSEAAYIARCPSHFGGLNSIGSLATTVDWFIFLS